MFLQEARINLGYVTKEVSTGVIRIFAYASGLSLETREPIGNLCKTHICFLRNLLQHDYGLPSDAPAVLLVLRHLFTNQIRRYIKRFGKPQGVELLNLPRSYNDIVCNLVSYEDVAVPVMDDASCRIYHRVHHGIVVGVHLVFVIKNLDAEKLDNQDACCHTKSDKKLVFSIQFHIRTIFSLLW